MNVLWRDAENWGVLPVKKRASALRCGRPRPAPAEINWADFHRRRARSISPKDAAAAASILWCTGAVWCVCRTPQQRKRSRTETRLVWLVRQRLLIVGDGSARRDIQDRSDQKRLPKDKRKKSSAAAIWYALAGG